MPPRAPAVSMIFTRPCSPDEGCADASKTRHPVRMLAECSSDGVTREPFGSFRKHLPSIGLSVMSRMFWRACAAAASVALAAGTLAAGPASAGPVPSTSDNTPIYWAGNLWLARNSPVVQRGPAPNYWLAGPTNAYTDEQNRLHLLARQIEGRWFCAAVTSVKSDYGYGTYRFVINTPLRNFDPMAVVGMFTYNDSVAYSEGHQEIDVEL